MKKAALLILFSGFCFMMHPALLMAEEFLGVPVIPGGKTLLKNASRLEMLSPVTHDEAKRFYEKAFEDLKDIKFRDWEDATYIEDDSNNPWHSVTISKKQENGMTNILIVKDNWTWIIGTLLLRFIGVFVVLLCLFLGMSIYGSILSRMSKGVEAQQN
ncbi:MAG: hypothetical protein PVG99_13610 [Desulfobacteraceae bacterium]|jgi:hypothetical protein